MALYSSGSDVSIHWPMQSAQRRTEGYLIQFPQGVNKEIQQNFFNMGFMVFLSLKSRHSTVTVNAIVLTRLNY